MQHCKRLSVKLKIWNVVLRVRVTFSSIVGGEGYSFPICLSTKMQNKKKFHVFNTCETGFCARID